MKILSLTNSEEQLMLVIWKLDSAYMKDIMLSYPEPKPHQNTVSTFLKLLIEKNYLSIEKKGRIYKYIPKISFDNYRVFQLDNLISTFYDNNPNSLLKDLNLSQELPVVEPMVEKKTVAEVIEESLLENAKQNTSKLEASTVEQEKKKKKKKEKAPKKEKKEKRKKK